MKSVSPDKKIESGKNAPQVVKDEAYRRSVKEFMKDKFNSGDPESDEFMRMVDYELTKIHDSRVAEKVSDIEMAPALAYLLGTLSTRDPEIPGNLGDDAEKNEYNQKEYDKAKKILLDAGGKIFVDRRTVSDIPLVFRDMQNVGMVLPGNLSGRKAMELLRSNPAKLLEEIGELIYHNGSNISESSGRLWRATSERATLTEDEKDEELRIAIGVKALYQLQVIRDSLAVRIAENKEKAASLSKVEEIKKGIVEFGTASAVSPFTSVRTEQAELESAGPKEKTKDKANEKGVDMSEEGPFGVLYNNQKNVQEVLKVVTPEMKNLMLKKLLNEVDIGIQGAKEFAEANEGSPIRRKTVAQFGGAIVRLGHAAVYQKMAIAALNKFISIDEVANMPMRDFLKALGYDLTADPRRAKLLNKYTDALM